MILLIIICLFFDFNIKILLCNHCHRLGSDNEKVFPDNLFYFHNGKELAYNARLHKSGFICESSNCFSGFYFRKFENMNIKNSFKIIFFLNFLYQYFF